MAITIACSKCQKGYRIKDELAGRRVKCPNCSTSIQVPAARQEAAPPAATAAREPPRAAATPKATVAIDKRTALSAPAASLRVTGAAAPAVRSGVKPALSREEVLAQVLAGFRGEMPAHRTSPMYLAGVLFTALVMIALPLVYVGLIGTVIWAVYWHMLNDAGILGSSNDARAAIFLLLVYLSPLAIGGILIVFMIKPLFASSARGSGRRSLRRQSEPVLFALVDKVCAVVDAPVPKRIDIDCDVNASASMRRGMLSAILGRDLVLTIGMPLAAGLDMEQFAGVLAHEFGHFSQGVGMRLTYIVRSINHWFLRAVYQRDSWDVWLATSTRRLDIRISWIMYLARFGVWITRKVLWALMMLGNLVAGFMLRQMEFDADGYQIRMVGSNASESTTRKVQLLSLAYKGAQVDTEVFYREGRLPDDLPQLMIANISQIPKSVHAELDESIEKSKTGLFDSHPADKDRIAAARRAAEPGIFRCGLPASILFSDFAATTRNVTYDLYCQVIGNHVKSEDLHPVAALLARQGKDQQAGNARQRFFGGQFNTLRSWRLPEIMLEPPDNLNVSRKRLDAARQEMAAAHAGYAAVFPRYEAADVTIVQARQIGTLLAANVSIRRDEFQRSFGSEAECGRAARAATQDQSQLATQLEPFEALAGKRLTLSLELLDDPHLGAKLSEIASKRQDCAALCPMVSRVGANLTAILAMRAELAVLAAVCGHLSGNENNAALIQKIRDYLNAMHEQIARMHALFSDLPYPFDHAKGEITLTSYLLERLPSRDNPGETYQAAETLLNNLMTVYVRAVDRLCLIAEEVETAAGLQPLDLPTGGAESTP
jgi:predicted Zn finger-like uncharacterized protein